MAPGGAGGRVCRRQGVRVWTGAGWHLRGGSPPGPGRGIQAFSRESPDAKSRGGWPPAPPFYSPLAARSFCFGGRATLFRSIGYYDAHVGTLIWKLSFAKMLFSIFSLENASQIGFRISGEIVPLSYQGQRSPKRANGSERAINPGVQGRSPGSLSPHFSGEMGTPAGQVGPPGRCAPRPRKSLDHPKGTQYRTAPPPGAGRATGRCAPRRLRSYPSEGHAAPGCPWQVVRV